MDDFELRLGLSSTVISTGFAASARSTLRRLGQFSPQLMALRSPPSPAILDGRGDDETMIWAKVEFIAPSGATVVDPLRENRSHSSSAGSA